MDILQRLKGMFSEEQAASAQYASTEPYTDWSELRLRNDEITRQEQEFLAQHPVELNKFYTTAEPYAYLEFSTRGVVDGFYTKVQGEAHLFKESSTGGTPWGEESYKSVFGSTEGLSGWNAAPAGDRYIQESVNEVGPNTYKPLVLRKLFVPPEDNVF